MKEYAVVPADVETPVFNPDVYLLRKGNKAFIERKVDYPSLKQDYESLIGGGFGFFVVACSVGFLALVTFAARLPAITFLMVVLELILIYFAYQSLLKWQVSQRDTAGGWIIPGTVIEAETVKIYVGKRIKEVIRIRYRFAAPSGVIEEAFVEDSNMEANHIIAPQPNTPIYVWYKDDGTYYLL